MLIRDKVLLNIAQGVALIVASLIDKPMTQTLKKMCSSYTSSTAYIMRAITEKDMDANE